MRRSYYGSMSSIKKVLLRLSALALALTFAAPASANVFQKSEPLPRMRWDGAPQASVWTAEALQQVADHDAELTHLVPGDIDIYCPGYAKASLADRRAFWVSLLSATASYESGFNARASGMNGRYVGLMQITLSTARLYGCDATSTAGLKDGVANLSCAVDIVAPRVAADGMVAGQGNRGIARDWGPWSKSRNRAAIAAWTRAQAYCQS